MYILPTRKRVSDNRDAMLRMRSMIFGVTKKRRRIRRMRGGLSSSLLVLDDALAHRGKVLKPLIHRWGGPSPNVRTKISRK